jgi:hypothetical protein
LKAVALALQSKTFGGASAGVGQMAQPDAQPVEEYEYVSNTALSGIECLRCADVDMCLTAMNRYRPISPCSRIWLQVHLLA